MNIDRERDQGGLDEAVKRIKFCLDQFEKAEGFRRGINWQSEVVPGCSVEEILGALVAAEQQLNWTGEVEIIAHGRSPRLQRLIDEGKVQDRGLVR